MSAAAFLSPQRQAGRPSWCSLHVWESVLTLAAARRREQKQQPDGCWTSEADTDISV